MRPLYLMILGWHESQIPEASTVSACGFLVFSSLFSTWVLSKRIGNKMKGMMGYSGTCWLKIRPLNKALDFGGVPQTAPLWAQSTRSLGQSGSSAWLRQGEGNFEVSNSDRKSVV